MSNLGGWLEEKRETKDERRKTKDERGILENNRGRAAL